MRLLMLLAALATSLATTAAAAVLSDRSPFAQGLWWDQTRPGSGFDIMNAGGNVMVVWYTYDTAGNPTWYTAQGPQATLGQDWALLKHRWVGGKHQDPVTVGSLKVGVNHAESVTISWTQTLQTGSIQIVPYILSGVGNEVDHTGLWFDPNNSGWGMSIIEQGPFNGAALFYYDTNGEPTWASGFERGQGSVNLYRPSNGACPYCTYRAPLMTAVGKVNFEFAQEAFVTLRNNTTLAMSAGINAGGARMTQLSRPASLRAADRSLATFDDASLLAYMKAGIATIPVSGGCSDFSASPSPSVPASVFSDTNLQEAGVDEASLVKSDGTYIYTYAQSGNSASAYYVPRLPEVRIAQVDPATAKLSVLGSRRLGNANETVTVASAGLYLRPRQLVSVHGTAPGATCTGFGWSPGYQWQQGQTRIEAFDTTSVSSIASRGQFLLDGHLVSSRRIGNMLYVVTRHVPKIDGLVPYAPAGSAAAAANAQLIAATPLDKFLPKYTEPGRTATAIASTAVSMPPQAGRAPLADFVILTAIDLDALRVTDTLAIAGGTEVAYASTANLVVATSRSEYRNTFGALLSTEPYFQRTDVHMIPLAGTRLGIPASASVEGFLDSNLDKSAFRFSESGGSLRVVTGSNAMWGGAVKNRLTILQRSPNVSGMLSTVSYLPNDARPEPLGKTGELLYSTRFAGDRLYAVTFRMIDPLYVIDLSDSKDPRIAGSLAVAGYADYLHPLPNGFLMGIGKDAVPASNAGDGNFAWYQGLQVALYDVRDAATPKLVDRAGIGKRGSNTAVTTSHQALSVLTQADGSLQFAMPAQVNDGTVAYGSGDSTYYNWQYSALLRYRIDGLASNAPKLVPLPSLVTSQASGYGVIPGTDDVTVNGRSVLFPNGVVYVGNGKFWNMESSGATSGPY